MESPVPTPPSKKQAPISPSPLHLSHYNCSPISLHELLHLSPSPIRRPRPAAAAEELSLDLPRRRRRSRAAAAAAAATATITGCASSPRIARRARRRLEREIGGEEREDEGGKSRRRRKQIRAASAMEEACVPSAGPNPSEQRAEDSQKQASVVEIASSDGHSSLEGLWEQLVELMMWKDAAKSALWFGLGSIFFLSTSFSNNINFSIISAICHLGILILGLAFFRDSVPQREQLNWGRSMGLTEEDILRAARVILPMANAAITKAQVIFSGEPLMTLKVLPVLLFGAKYGHLITLWRLLATGFLFSFTIPKLYTCYSQKIHRRVESARKWISEAWVSCPRKRVVGVSVTTLLWNLFGVKARIVAVFISLVVLRCYKHRPCLQENGGSQLGEEEEEQEQGVVVVGE